MKARVVILGLTLFVSTSTVPAQFLIPVVVYDPTNYANAVLRHYQLSEQTRLLHWSYWQQVETYLQLVREYDHLVRMARQMADKERYRPLITPWRQSEAVNLYGTTGAWMQAINRGLDVLEGYKQAIEELQDYGTVLANIPPEQLRRLKTRYGTIELLDAANLYGIELLGSLRSNSGPVEKAIRALEDDSLSGNDAANTQIAVLNKINAAGTIALRTSQDTNKLLVALLEQRLTESKRQRDAQAIAINTHIAFQQNAIEVGLDGIRGTTRVLENFWVP